LSNSLDAGSSILVIKEAIAIHRRPQILNSDQGCQFTCKEYIKYIKTEHIQISMDSRGRALDNIYIERFWRTKKYQYIYLNSENNGLELYKGIKKWIERYHNRDHQGINRMKPNIIYYNAA